MSVTSIAVIDDYPLMVEALVSLLSGSELRVVATGTVAKDIIRIANNYKPEVMVVDLNMTDAYDAIAAIAPAIKIVAFTAASGVDAVIRALGASVDGYVLKGSSAEELIQAIHCVRLGETHIPQAFASHVIAALRNTSPSGTVLRAGKFDRVTNGSLGCGAGEAKKSRWRLRSAGPSRTLTISEAQTRRARDGSSFPHEGKKAEPR